MRHSTIRIKFIILFSIFLSVNREAKSQVNAADSLWFTQLFDQSRYADDSSFPGSWYVRDTIHCIPDLYAQLDENFKFGFADFDSVAAMQVSDSLFFDTLRNITYNAYPFVYQQPDPMVYVDFSLNGKQSRAYSMYYPSEDNNASRYAYFVLPGNGNNSATEVVQGYGYYNTWCFVNNELKQRGDVYTLIKPNEDARALYHNKNKLNHFYMVAQLDSMRRPYGVNYLAEVVATIKYLQKKYCKVIVLGISEGGYTALLASMMTHPDGALISAGYAVGVDTSWASYSLLQQKFDSLVFRYDKATIRDNILGNKTKYLFTYGDLDPVNLMQAEHDSNYTEQFLNDSIHCSFYYDYSYHSFPACSIIDSFTNKLRRDLIVDYFIPYTTGPDTLMTIVTNCGISPYSFDLYKNDTLYKSFTHVSPDTLIALVDSGKYYLRNIVSEWGDTTSSDDTLVFYKPTPIPNVLNTALSNLDLRLVNPVSDRLSITLANPDHRQYTYRVSDLYGIWHRTTASRDEQVSIPMQRLSPGIYFLQISDGQQQYTVKLTKL